MGRIDVSVVVTIHNAERYLTECLNSVLEQTLKSIEILCIDGGSVDKTPNILREYEEKDSRIKIVNDSNTSYGHKVNIGISKAKGKYISILESDDMYEPNMLRTLYDVAEKNDCDFVDADYKEFFLEKGEYTFIRCRKYSTKKVYNMLIDCENKEVNEIRASGIWTGLYKKAFLEKNEIRLNESPGASYQDNSFGFLTSILGKRIYHMEQSLYNYRIDNSDSSFRDDTKIFEVVGECRYLERELNKRNLVGSDIWKKYFLTKYGIFWWNLSRLSDAGAKKFLPVYEEELKTDILKYNIKKEDFDNSERLCSFFLLEQKDAFVDTVKLYSIRNKTLNGKDIISIMKSIGEEKIVIVGAGSRCERILDILEDKKKQIVCICDNNPNVQNTLFEDIPVVSYDEAISDNKNAKYLITSYINENSMKKQLLDYGIAEHQIICL